MVRSISFWDSWLPGLSMPECEQVCRRAGFYQRKNNADSEGSKCRIEKTINQYKDKRLINAVIIGFVAGIYEMLGKGGTQAIINMAGNYVGKEILRFAHDNQIPIRSLSDFQAFAREQGLAGQLDFHQTGEKTYVRISKCGACPKKVGHFEFDGTACPWGGILTGVMEEITGNRYSTSSRLTPGEACIIEFRTKNNRD